MHPSKFPAVITLVLWATAHSQDVPAPPQVNLDGLSLDTDESKEKLKILDKKITHLKELEKSVDQLDLDLAQTLLILKAEKEKPKDP